MIYLYGLVDAPPAAVAARLDGVGGLQAPPVATDAGRWTLVSSAHDAGPVAPRRRDMLAHTRVVEAMMAEGLVLPARFGLVAEDVPGVRALIAAQEGALAAQAARIAGCSAYGVRVDFPQAPALAATLAAAPDLQRARDRLLRTPHPAPFAQADFGRALAEALDRRRGLAQKALLVALRPLVRDHVLRRPDSDCEVLCVEALVPEGRLAAVEQVLATAAADCGFAGGAPARIVLTGPAPAYHFVRLSLGTGAQEAAA